MNTSKPERRVDRLGAAFCGFFLFLLLWACMAIPALMGGGK